MYSQTTISILMAVKNEALFIEEAINSILYQTYPFWELIVVDDGSSDDTVLKVKQFSDKRIVLLISSGQGKNAAYNDAFSQATGALVCFFAGDDVMLNTALKDRIEPLLERLDQKAVSLCKLKTFSEDPKYDGIVVPKSNKGGWTGASFLMTRKVADTIFPIPIDLPNEDTWARLCIENFNVVSFSVSKVLMHYRIHQNNSHSRYVPFQVFNEKLHARGAIAYNLFLEKYETQLNCKQVCNLCSLITAETFRYNRQWLSLLCMRKLNFRKRLGLLGYSNSFFLFFKKEILCFIYRTWVLSYTIYHRNYYCAYFDNYSIFLA